MSRPRIKKKVEWHCNFTHITPVGQGIIQIEEILVSHEELEALRLKDCLGLEQKQAAKAMNISQPTFHRLLREARKKISDAIVNSKQIKIKS